MRSAVESAPQYYSKLPHAGPKPDMVFILDPMLATAATAIAAVNMLLDWGIPSARAREEACWSLRSSA